MILIRIVHIGSAMTWFGGAIIGSFFLTPTSAALTVLSGTALYWHDSAGLQAAWITSPAGLAFTIGGLAAIVAFVGGFVLIGPRVAEQTAVQNELARGDGVPTEAQRQRLERAGRRMQLADQIETRLAPSRRSSSVGHRPADRKIERG